MLYFPASGDSVIVNITKEIPSFDVTKGTWVLPSGSVAEVVSGKS
jgi:S-adenosylmethionine hydrolase